jgi:DNA repair protein SbcC/Rad50
VCKVGHCRKTRRQVANGSEQDCERFYTQQKSAFLALTWSDYKASGYNSTDAIVLSWGSTVIPRHVKLSGFLSYREEQEINFTTAALWMLGGNNGSGKSAIFDALTYALFGCHRGGSQNANELINKESNALGVEFEFSLEGVLYRAKRTLKRNPKGGTAATQQLFTQITTSDGEPHWEAVPDTSKKAEFDQWVANKIGLKYETFTSSVLLLQGKAEKLLDAKPSGRAEVLAEIVDLDRYKRLYDKANERKLECKARLEAISHQTDAVPEVTDMELLGAVQKIEECEAARKEAQARLEASQSLEVQAHRWVDFQGRLQTAQDRLQTTESLLGEAAKIEREFSRWKELREVLPAVKTVLTERSKIQESQRKTEHCVNHREEAQTRRQAADHEKEQAQKQRQTLQNQLAKDEQKLSTANIRLRELEGILQTARRVEEQEATLNRDQDEISRLPEDPSAEVRTLQTGLERLQELQRILPILERFQAERYELQASQKQDVETRELLKKLEKEGVAAKAKLIEAETSAVQAQEARTRADQEAAVSRTLLQQAKEAVESFKGLSGSPKCSSCGQSLTKKHFAQELTLREEAIQDAEKQNKTSVKKLAEATKIAETQAENEKSQRDVVQQLRDEYTQTLSKAKQFQADCTKLAESLGLRYSEMPEVYRKKISVKPMADWTKSQYPQPDELAAMRQEMSGIDGVKRQIRDAVDKENKWKALDARIKLTQQNVKQLKATLPKTDVALLSQESLKLRSEETTLTQAIKATKLTLQQLETTVNKLSQEAHDAIQTITELVGRLQTEEVVRKNSQENTERAMKQLSESWAARVEKAGTADYSEWNSEYEELNAKRIEERAKQLEIARGGLAKLREDVTTLQSQIDAIPAAERLTPETVRTMIQTSRLEFESLDKSLRESLQAKSVLDGYRDQRDKLGDQFRKIDAEFNRYKLLAELLGRDRLQRFLVRKAERLIVDYANNVLDRLSSGQLYLKLAVTDDGSGTDKALDLDCFNRVTGESPINVVFLSGSQKFRVAVSLALAIGQYSSRQHRPIESVIIDEGFGCLDRQGRQIMIQELLNLREHLKCILLVSHQEEFAEAFSHGYRFEIEEGATRILRV